MRDPGVMLHTLKGWVAVTPEFAAGFLDIHPMAEHFDIELDRYSVYDGTGRVIDEYVYPGAVPSNIHFEDFDRVKHELAAEIKTSRQEMRDDHMELAELRARTHQLQGQVDSLKDWGKSAQHNIFLLRKDADTPPLSPVAEYMSSPHWEQPPPTPASTITTSKASPLYHYWRHLAINTSGFLLGAAFVFCVVTGNWPWMFLPAGLFGLLLGWAQLEKEHMARVHALVAAALKPQDR